MAARKKPEAPDLSGFTTIDTELDQYPTWDWDKDGDIYGTVEKVKQVTVTRQGKEEITQFAVVDVDGNRYLLWHTANLDNLFTIMEPGGTVYVHFIEKVALSGGRTMRKFDAAYKPA